MDYMNSATAHAMSRPAATSSDTDYTLSLGEVSDRYAKAGHPRTLRSLQRYCVNGHLDAQKIATATGDKFLVTSLSVARHIAQIEELTALEPDATGRDAPRQVATPFVSQQSDNKEEPSPSTGDDRPRQAATSSDNDLRQKTESATSRYVEQLEKRIEEKDDVIGMLRGELSQRNDELVRRNERERETNILIRGLQNLVLQLQPGRTRSVDALHDDPLIKAEEGEEASA